MTVLREWVRRQKHRWRIRRCKKELDERDVIAQSHNLDTPLIVSLTSYPPRFPELALTLRCLLRQSIEADRTILWIAEDDVAQLPDEVRALEQEGLEICTCPDYRSYKKLLPLLEALKEPATIVTADDDVYYGPEWLASLLNVRAKTGAKVVGGRGHRIALTQQKTPAGYWDWQHNVGLKNEPSSLIFPTGVGGVLYSPGALSPIAVDWHLAQQLCPTADDIWFYWMHRLQGHSSALTGERLRVLEWVKDPNGGLLSINGKGGNDRQIMAMINHFGWPDP